MTSTDQKLNTAPRPRTRKDRLRDSILRRVSKLQPGSTDYTIQDVDIPMRDGVRLRAEHFAPVGTSRGTVLIRTPYGPGMFGMPPFAEHGYNVLVVQCRGRSGSEGVFEPFMNEVADGADTVAWLRDQPWFEGRFATYGPSYLSFNQWALLVDPPPELVTAIAVVSLHDLSKSFHADGAVDLEVWLNWAEMTSAGKAGLIKSLRNLGNAATRLRPGFDHLPVAGAMEVLGGDRSSWFRDYVEATDLDNPFWTPSQLAGSLERTDIPVLLQTGWSDIFLPQTFEQYHKLRERGTDVALTVGPWDHARATMPGAAGSVLFPEALAWLQEHLAGEERSFRREPVRVRITGSDEWRDYPSWPPASKPIQLHLADNGRLSDSVAPSQATVSFTYDPTNPTPSVGGRLFSISETGSREDNTLAQRDDVIVFDSDILPSALDLVGVPTVELLHGSDNPNADLFVRISDVDAKGRSRNVTDGFVRLRAATPDPELVRIQLDPIAHRFASGHRIRLLIAGGSFPHRSRNTGLPAQFTGSELKPSKRTIRLEGSSVTIPLL